MLGCPDLRLRAAGALAAGLALLPAAAGAAWPSDPQINVPVSTAPGHQVNVHTSMDGLGGLLVAWEDLRGADRDVYVQRMSPSGGAAWTADGVPACTAAGWQGAPLVVEDGTGGAIVLWTDLRNGVHTDLHAQRVSAAGAPLWGAQGSPVCTAQDAQLGAALVADGAGGAFVAWTDHRGVAGADIYAQRLDGSGNALWTADGAQVTVAAGAQFSPRLVPDGSGGVIVAWQDLRTGDASGYNLYAQRLDALGSAQWAPDGVSLCALPTDPESHAACSDGAGGVIAVWQDVRGATQTAEDLYAQRVDAAGTPMWDANGVPVTTASGSQLRPHPIPDGAGGAIVVWDDRRFSLNVDVFAQRLNGSGSALWAANGVSVASLGERQAMATVAADGAGGAFVAWHDYRSPPFADVHASRLDGTGATPWSSNGVPVSTAPRVQHFPSLASDGTAAYVAWQDERSGSTFDVYAQRIESDGSLGGGVTGVSAAVDLPEGLSLRVSPNPARRAAEVRFSLPRAGHVSLSVVDGGGRRVRTLAGGRRAQGTHAVSWDGRDGAGRQVAAGVYFLRLEALDRLVETRMVRVR